MYQYQKENYFKITITKIEIIADFIIDVHS